MNEPRRFFICPVCFTAGEACLECHGHAMLCCDVGEPGGVRCKPVTDARGRLLSRAPRWYLEAVGWLRAAERSGPQPPAS